MNRDARISCRTTGVVRRELEEYAQREKVSVTAALELILTDFFKSRKESIDWTERMPSRLKLSARLIPMKALGSPEPGAECGAALDLSLSGLAKASAMLLNRLAK
jgi:hypothetical protein